MSERVLITSSDPEGLARAVEEETGEQLPWYRLDARGFEEATVWFCAGAPPESPLSLPRLRWIQSGWAGVENWFLRPEWGTEVILTRTVGDFPQRMAQHVFGYLLAQTLGVDEALRQMADRSWKRWTPDSIAGKNLLVVGMGAIGLEIAATARAFQMHVAGVRRGGGGEDRRSHDSQGRDLAELLGWADVVVNLLPLTPETESFWNAERFASMKAGSTFINVSRGGTVEEQALVRALGRGKPRAAILDVFREEPLPGDHPLRGRENVWITPHVAGASVIPSLARDFAENWLRFRAGEPLQNRVDRARGY
ncbi:MAG: D-2-hydroxyacid dehydrogenase [Candidatus Eisenbacteria bacterium]|uniref:D-2-hydroxyacid dehydrogenase n=1 Tax=Eiseniibacteriota bacterium TaxID=2212470 RepID=A0A538T9S2_UNCEI|nr:MAG: D-2-hydroxyacid dehydrogenase [Candidatus Eisenbacteria bacterium]